MFDVLKFIEHHRYRRVIIENVVDIAMQAQYRLAWQVWREQLTTLGYSFRVVSLNSMHAQFARPPGTAVPRPALHRVLAQGRPRTGHRQGHAALAWCPRCARSSSHSRRSSRPHRRPLPRPVRLRPRACGTTVEPGWLPAAAAIDWTLRGTRIGDRAKPLAEKTRARIAAGIARYWRPFTLEAAGNTFERRPGVRTWPADEVLTTLHTTASKALAVPVEGRDGKEARRCRTRCGP
jgi:DNA (cytosine-5)-methyltransferase 1